MIGMQLEVIPLDAHLFQYLPKSVDIHVNLTAYLPDRHENNLSKQKTKQPGLIYMKIWHLELGPYQGVLSSKQIVKDIICVIDKNLPIYICMLWLCLRYFLV